MRRVAALSALFTFLFAITAFPAAADPAETSRGSAFGLSATLPPIDPQPLVEANAPPGESVVETFIEIPADPLVVSATGRVEADAAIESEFDATLRDVIEANSSATVPDLFNARGFAVTEDLDALIPDPATGALLTADVLEAEALASCVDGQAQFFAGSDIETITLADTVVPVVDELLNPGGALDPILGPDGPLTPILGPQGLQITGMPNNVLLDQAELGLRIIAYETNWDSADGTTDGSDTVFVNALHIIVTPDGLLGTILGAQDIIVSHAEASIACADDAPPVAPDDPLGDVSKDSSADTVQPGDEFTYTITVPNSDDTCTLTDVMVVDTITGPEGAEIVDTDPPADTVDGLTVTYDDVGPIAPGEEVTLDITVSVPDDAQDGDTFSESVEVTALCDGEPVDGGIDFDGPTVGDPDPLADISKTASSLTVAPGSEFDYTITIPNSDDTCTLTDVMVTDVISGPVGSTVVDTDPEADSVTGLTVVYDDVGPIAPGDEVVLTITVSVPSNAPDGAEYSEALTVTALCDGDPVEGGVDFDGPTVDGGVRPGADLPRTGPAFAALAGLGLLGAGAAAWRVSRGA